MTDPDELACGALVFDERIPGDRSTIERLRSTPGTAVRDLHAEQLTELAGLPGVTTELAEPPRWVYYPWHGTLARILGPAGYRRLRLDRNRDKITPDEQEYFARLSIGVVGASVGHLVAVGLASEGLFGTLRITDFDSIELSNLNRLPVSVLDYGDNKAVVAARRIAEIDPYLTVEALPDGLDVAGAGAFVDGLDVVIEVCDSLDVKVAVREQARKLGVPVIMVTSDLGTVDIERFDLDADRPLFHGLAGELDVAELAGLPSAAKTPFVMKILGAEGLSARMAASMLEIGQSLVTWPHLAGDAIQAAACAVMAVRRLSGLPSGRLDIDIAGRLDDLAEPVVRPDLSEFEPAGPYRNLAEPRSDLEAVVRAGQLAPSGGNCQPWRFILRDNAIRIELDEQRTTAMDVEYRASYVAIGAAVCNMRIAAAALGVLGEVEVFGHGAVAQLRLGPGRDDRLAAWATPMLERVTNRQLPQGDQSLGLDDLAALQLVARDAGAELAVVADRDGLSRAAGIVADADRVRFLVPTLHREMMSELLDPRTDPVERGIDLRTLEMGSGVAMLDLAGRGDVMAELAALDQASEADVGQALGAGMSTLVTSSSAVVAVAITGSGPVDYLRGGEAMERVWIAAGARGFAVQPMVPLFLFTRDDTELELIAGRYAERMSAARQQLRELFGLRPEQHLAMMLRLSRAPAPSAISLRSADTVQSTEMSPHE